MATKARSHSCFNFLKEGLILPKRNLNLFAPVFALIVVFTSLRLLTDALAIRPLADDILLHVKDLQCTDPASPKYAKLLKEIQKDAKELMLVGAAYLLAVFIIGSIMRIITNFAAATTYSGKEHTFWDLLCKAKGNIKGPVITLAFVYVLQFAYTMFIIALAALGLLLDDSLVLLYLDLLLVLLASLFFIYFSVVCSVSVVVSVVETGCHGAGAVSQAWRLMKGKKMQAVLFIVVYAILLVVISLLDMYAMGCSIKSMACELLLEFVYVLLLGVVELFSIGAVTVYYYECKESNEEAVHSYAKLPSDEAYV